MPLISLPPLLLLLLCSLDCRARQLEERLAGVEAARAALEQQLAVSKSQLADTRALMDSTQVRHLLKP